MKLTIIGNGNMAVALIAGLYKSYQIEVVGRNDAKLQAIAQRFDGVIVKNISSEYDISQKDVILCVKPYALSDVSSKLKGNANNLFSILAGTTIQTIKESIKSSNYIRVMPNISASYGSSMTTLTGDIVSKGLALDVFRNIGKTLWLDSEKELDIATAIAGSGPAYLALVADAMADGGVKSGLKRADAKAIVLGLFEGFGDLLSHNEASSIKEQVMSPSGTTACGVSALEDANIRSAFIKAVEAGYNRALELAKK